MSVWRCTYLSKENKGIVPAQLFHDFYADIETKDNSTPCHDLCIVSIRRTCTECWLRTRKVSVIPSIVAFLFANGSGSSFGGGSRNASKYIACHVDMLVY